MAIVLIADDRREDVEHLIEAIEYKKHGVIYCACSRDAQEEIRKKHIDCAIYDLVMPRYADGSEVSAENGGILLIKETRRFLPDARIVVHTSELEEKCRKAIESFNVPVFIKNDNRVGDILRTLGL